MPKEPTLPTKPSIKIQLGDYVTEAKHRQFASKKFGYGAYGMIKINNEPYRLSLNIIEL
jgi:hypothetical protein